MKKTYIVRLSDDEREACLTVVKKLKGSSQKVRRANILLKADTDIAEGGHCGNGQFVGSS